MIKTDYTDFKPIRFNKIFKILLYLIHIVVYINMSLIIIVSSN